MTLGIVASARRRMPGVPTKVLGVYHRTDTAERITRSEMDHYNVILLAFARSDDPGTGSIEFDVGSYPSGATQLKNDIQTVAARGCRVLLSVGGSTDNGITVKTDTQIGEFVTDMAALVDEYGFHGMDWDLENGGTGTNVYGLSQASAALKNIFGPDFIVGCAPAPFTTVYEDFAKLSSVSSPNTYAGRPCDLFGPQFYDYTTATDAARITGIGNYIANQVSAGIPASAILIGGTYENGSYLGASGGMYPEHYVTAYNNQIGAGRNIRGAYIWSSANPEDGYGWLFVDEFAPVLGT